jgi:hypothetical protein
MDREGLLGELLASWGWLNLQRYQLLFSKGIHQQKALVDYRFFPRFAGCD